MHLPAYNGTQIKVVGKSILHVLHKCKFYPILFHVAETNFTPILRLKTSLSRNSIKQDKYTMDLGCKNLSQQQQQNFWSKMIFEQ